TSCRNFASQSEIKLSNSRGLEVLQREFAVVGLNRYGLRIVGSDGATTCLIVIAKHTTSRWTLVAHLDDRNPESLSYHILDIIGSCNKEEKSCKEFSLYLCGCFDTKHYPTSQNILNKFLTVFLKDDNKKLHITLKLALIGELNTHYEEKSNKYLPLCQGIAINIEDGQVFPADFHEDPPLLELRWMKIWSGCDSFKKVSTSPEAEKEKCFRMMRKSLQFAMNNRSDLVFNDEPSSTGFERLKRLIRTFLQIKKLISAGRENHYCILTQENDGSTDYGKGLTDVDTILSELKKISPEDDESYGKSDGLNIDEILKTCFSILEPCDAPLKTGMPVDYVWRLIFIISRSSGAIIMKSIEVTING
uniref:Uncharacterized protein n=1 Tax=Romanomermis culicivorax TaxID=13658 RepID=A0A915JRX3_ROMCU